jgi:hypothetical protein
MKVELQRIIDQIEAGEYKEASEALEAIPDGYALPEVDTLKVNAVLFDTHHAQESSSGPFMGFYAKSAVWRLKGLLGLPGAAEGLQSLHAIADLTIKALFNSKN